MGIHLDLFLTFLKIGSFTFGGGYAMISMMESICVEKKKWITHDDMMNVTVLAESTPGPIAINCATFVGFRQAGISGSAVATLGMVLPSFLVIFLISQFLDHFLEIAIVAHAFRGIKLAVGLLIVNAALNMLKKMPKRLFSRAMVLASFGAMLCVNIFSWNFSTISLMLLAAAAGLGAFMVGAHLSRKRGNGN